MDHEETEMHANQGRRRHSPRDALAPGHAAASRRTGMPPWLVVAVAAATAAMAALTATTPNDLNKGC
jgi:hypothetical protein